MPKKSLILLCFIFFCLGVGGEKILDTYFPDFPLGTHGTQIRSGGYTYINPLIECEVGMIGTDTGDFSELETNLNDYITEQTAAGDVRDVAVYYRDLNNGPWFGINENSDFSPASLLKIPVLMAFFKQADTEPQLLATQVTYDHDVTSLPMRYSQSAIEKGKTYSITNLLERMIESSDNTALSLLEEHISMDAIKKVTIELGMTTPQNMSAEDFMSVKEYSSLFRVLYNASYLNREYSDQALRMLAKSEFKQGIVAGVPASVVVSHKYGEREVSDGVDQLHDCGIVYYPEHPYLICIMTRGTNLTKQTAILKTLSHRTYEEVDSRYKKH